MTTGWNETPVRGRMKKRTIVERESIG